MQFQVKGTRKDNGRSATATVDAANHVEAERKASKLLVVSSVTAVSPPEPPPLPDPPIDDPADAFADIGPSDTADFEPMAGEQSNAASPAVPPLSYASRPAPISAASRVAGVPAYQDIVSGNRWLQFLASVVAAVGWLAVICGGLVIGLTLLGRATPSSSTSSSPFGGGGYTPVVPIWVEILPGLGIISYGIGCLIVAGAIRLACGVGMAIRDVARIAARY